jgi:hypothetical protein
MQRQRGHQRHGQPICLAAPSCQAPKSHSDAPEARGLTAKVGTKRSWSVSWLSSSDCSWKALTELDSKLPHGSRPFDPSSPAQAGILDSEIEELQRSIVVGKAAARFDDLAQRPV